MLPDIKKLKHTQSGNFFLMAGPCAIEGENMAMEIAEKIVELTDRLKIPFIFKGSYRKANRSRMDSFTGIGDEKALKILQKVGTTFQIPTVTDIHSAEEAAWQLILWMFYKFRHSCAGKPTFWWQRPKPEKL
jgi:2-dehydro-3-deoxyphosphooctonate aldolase (KDO 8-P synthase)